MYLRSHEEMEFNQKKSFMQGAVACFQLYVVGWHNVLGLFLPYLPELHDAWSTGIALCSLFIMPGMLLSGTVLHSVAAPVNSQSITDATDLSLKRRQRRQLYLFGSLCYLGFSLSGVGVLFKSPIFIYVSVILLAFGTGSRKSIASNHSA